MMQHVEAYLAVRRSLGFALEQAERHLKAFASHCESLGLQHVRSTVAIDWAAKATTRSARYRRLKAVRLFSQYLRAEDLQHEVPPAEAFPYRCIRPTPFIYTGARRQLHVCIVLPQQNMLPAPRNGITPEAFRTRPPGG